MKKKNLLTMLSCLLALSLVLLPSLVNAGPLVASTLTTMGSAFPIVHQQVKSVTSLVYGHHSNGLTNTIVSSVNSSVYTTGYSTGNQFNVKSFGAVGDGRHDDTAAIQSTVNRVANIPGAVAFFPQGTYLISQPITIPSNTSLLGVGAGSAIMGNPLIEFPTGLFFVDTGTSTRQNISIASLTFNGASNLSNYLGNIGIFIGYPPSQGFNNISVTNSIFQNCQIAITVVDHLASGALQSNLTISNNKVYNTTRFGFGEIGNVNNLTISNNTLSNIGHDPDPSLTPWAPGSYWDAIYVQNGSDITIADNNISKFGDEGIEVGHYPYAPNVPAPSDIKITNNDIEQSTGGNDSGSGILISCAANVNISSNTIKDMNLWGIHVWDSSYTGDNIPTTNVTIQSNIIENTTTYEGIYIDLNNYGAVPVNNITVTKNTLTDIASTGIEINNNQNTNTNEYTISNNHINNCDGNFINALSGGGSLSGNICNNSQQDGIYTGPGVENMIINGNQILAYGLSQSNRYHGLLLKDGAYSVISSNKIDSGNIISHTGIDVQNASNTSCEVTNNIISNAATPIYSTSPLNIISGNQIS